MHPFFYGSDPTQYFENPSSNVKKTQATVVKQSIGQAVNEPNSYHIITPMVVQYIRDNYGCVDGQGGLLDLGCKILI